MAMLLKYTRILLFIFPLAVSAMDGVVPQVWNIQSDFDAVSRMKSLEEIHNSININKGNGALSSVALTGPSGVGKSYLAKMYADKYKHDYAFVWYFYASKNMDSQILQLAKAWNSAQSDESQKINIADGASNAEAFKEIKEFLEGANKDWLLIFDDMASPSDVVRDLKEKFRKEDKDWLLIYDDVNYMEDVRNYIPESHKKQGRSHVIFTSQNSGVWPSEVRVGSFSREESINSILQRNPEISREEASAIAASLGDYPLTVASAAASIANGNEFGRNWPRDPDGANEPFSSAVEYVVENSKKIRQISEGAYQLFLVMSYLSKDYIPEELLKQYYELDMGPKGRGFERDIQLLQSYLFVKEDQSKVEKTKYYHTHAIYQYAALKQIADEDRLRILDYISKSLASMYKAGGKASLDPKYVHVLEQTQSIVAMSEAGGGAVSPEYISLLVELIEFNSMVKREYNSSLEYGDRVHSAVNALPSSYDALKLRYYNDMSGVYWWVGKNRKGLLIQDKALSLSSNELHAKDEWLRGLLYRATHLTYMGDIDAALSAVKDADRHIGTYGFSSTKNKIFELYNSALTSQIKSTIYMNQGNFDRAFHEQEIALSNMAIIAESFSGKKKSTSRFNYFSNYYEIKMKRGGLKEDADDLERLYIDAEKAFGDSGHRLSALLLTLHGQSRIENGFVEEGLEMAEKSLRYFCQWFGGDMIHRDQALAYRVLGDAYFGQKKYKESYDVYLRARKTLDNAYVKKKTYDYSVVLVNLARSALFLGDVMAAKEYFKEHVFIFGFENKNGLALLGMMNEHSGLNIDS